MISFLKLVRYKNLLMVLLTLFLTKYALIHSFISTSNFSNFHFTLLSLSILCITAGGYIINDIFDIKADKINKPTKVFIGETITKINAQISYYIVTSIGLGLGIYLSLEVNIPTISLVFVGTVIGLYLYSKLFKRLLLIGNLITSFFIGLTIITLYIFESNHSNASIGLHEALQEFFNSFSLTVHIFFYTFFAFIITLIREIIKDIEDIKGDYAAKMKTLPILIGSKRAKSIVFIISSLTFCFLIITLKEIYAYKLLFGYALLFVVLPFGWFLYKLRITQNTKQYHKLSSLLKIIMVFGILSMLLFKL